MKLHISITCILFCCMLNSHAQVNKYSVSINDFFTLKALHKSISNSSFKNSQDLKATIFNQPEVKKRFNLRITPLPDDYYVKQLGFFCKKELQIQKTIKLPLSFRLGSLEYVNALEGKPNAFFNK